MRKLLFLTPLFLIGCTISQTIVYETDDLQVSKTATLIPARVEVRIFEDNRANIEENAILFDNPRQIRLNGKETCINSEKHYRKDTLVNQLSKMMVEHFNKARLFSVSFYGENPYSDHYLTGTLNSFYAQQEFSTGAAIGASFGLIGALATAGIKTPGKVIIDISDLRLYKKDGTLVKDFGNIYKEYHQEFQADASCWCVYWNANLMLKDFNTYLVEKIRADMAGIELE
ncbi:MAG TPA: hypothetical protein PLW96_04680 [Bacteroidales bacterium]|nr:hypothetical protein [Bacteroidales bacterium]